MTDLLDISDDDAQDMLDDGHCPACGKPIDFWKASGKTWFAECSGPDRHRYRTVEHPESRGDESMRRAVWDGGPL